MSSLGKKYIMALTGFALVGFVIGHLLGNLQMFLHPDWINEYAYKLHHMPYGLLWVVRLVMLVVVVLHIVTAVMLVIENRRARPQGYNHKRVLQASYASRTMRYSGLILFFFIVFHLAHFTIQNVEPEFQNLKTELTGVETLHGVYAKLLPSARLDGPTAQPVVHDVYSMVAIGFSPQYWYVSLFYVISMFLLCMHLRHGISSMFQSIGFRNAGWRKRLDTVSLVIAILLFIGYTSIPVATLAGFIKPLQTLTVTAL